MQSYRLNADEVAIINGLRLLTELQKQAIAYAIQELTAYHPHLSVVPANVIPLPRR